MSWYHGRYGVTARNVAWIGTKWRGHVTAPGLTGRRVIARTEHTYRTKREALGAARALRDAIRTGRGNPTDPNLLRAGRRHLAREARKARRRTIRRLTPSIVPQGRTVRTRIDWDTGTVREWTS